MKNIALLFQLLVLTFISFAQIADDTTSQHLKIYHLGEIIITETIDKDIIMSDQIQNRNYFDVGTALNSLPSVILNSFGSRNESTLNIRGFDIRSIPVFIDGIPVYIPYEGYVDLARLTTYNVSKIDLSKGFSSMTYGANTIGGAINIISQKPSKKLEIEAKIGSMSGNGYDTKLNIGSNLGQVYFQTSFSYLNREYLPLSKSFDTLHFEKDHKRDNSLRKDIKGSIKIGFTPNKTDEYSLNYIYSHGEKGSPTYLGTDENTPVRFWKWPYWDKKSIYYISKTAIGKKSVFKARMYYDKFKNKLDSYDDNSFSTQERRYAFTSFYDDYTVGGIIELSSNWNKNNLIRFSTQIKNDNHSEHNKGETTIHFADNTYSTGLENISKINNKTTVISGISYNVRQSLRAEDDNFDDEIIRYHPKNKNDMLNAQISTLYNLSNWVKINFNLAYKSRFSTMKNRYSYRMGRAIPNPELEPETALNLELGSTININDKLIFRPEFYYSRLDNTIQMVSNVQDNLSQMQNTGESEFMGIDFSVTYQPIDVIKIYTAYSFINQENISNPEILFTDVPKNKFFASADYFINKNTDISIFGEYNSKRNNESDASRVSPEFFVFNAQTSYSFAKYLKANMGVNNIFDNNYTIQEGYPEAGRNFYLSLYFKLQK